MNDCTPGSVDRRHACAGGVDSGPGAEAHLATDQAVLTPQSPLNTGNSCFTIGKAFGYTLGKVSLYRDLCAVSYHCLRR